MKPVVCNFIRILVGTVASKVALAMAALAAVYLVMIPVAQASSVRGYIEVNAQSGELYLAIDEGQAPRRIVGRENVLTELSNLRTGDFLVARGEIEALDYVVRIDTIESVGLKELIGPWSSVNFEVYEFEDFSRLNLYAPTKDDSGVTLSKTAEFKYVLAPDQGSRYSIFLSDNRSVAVGTLEFKAQKVKLSVIDPKTGRASQNISLSPLPVK